MTGDPLEGRDAGDRFRPGDIDIEDDPLDEGVDDRVCDLPRIGEWRWSAFGGDGRTYVHGPEFVPTWTVRDGVRELYDAYVAHSLGYEEFVSSRYLRIKHVREEQEAGRLSEDLRILDAQAT